MKRYKRTKTEVKQDGLNVRFAWVLAVATVLLTMIVRIRLLQLPLERDEGEYAYAGQLILQGIPPYSLAYNMKFPGIYGAYAFFLGIFGQTMAGVHLGLLVVNLGAIVLLFFIARRLFDTVTAVVTCATYALLTVSPSVLGLAAHATHFVVLPALGGILLLLKAAQSGRTGLVFWSGMLLGLAVLMKQPGALFVAFGIFYLASVELFRKRDKVGRVAARSGMLLLGALIPFGITCLILLRAGVFGKFWFWTFKYAREYASQLSLAEGVQPFRDMGAFVLEPTKLIWLAAAIGLTAVFWDKKARENRLFVVGFLIFSFLAVCPGLYFRQHYFVLMLPAVALLVGIFASAVHRALLERGQPVTVRILPLALVAVVFAHSIYLQSDRFFTMTPKEVSRYIYGANPFPDTIELAQHIKAISKSGDRIAVLGSEPQIYFYSQRLSASGHIYMYGLMEKQAYALTMQREFVKDMEARKPEYLVFVGVGASWIKQPDSHRLIFEWFERVQQEQNYTVTGLVDIVSPEVTNCYWDEDIEGRRPSGLNYLVLFKRNEES